MLNDAFDSIQCLICYKTFEECKGYVLKRHLYVIILKLIILITKGRVFNRQKTIFLEKLK